MKPLPFCVCDPPKTSISSARSLRAESLEDWVQRQLDLLGAAGGPFGSCCPCPVSGRLGGPDSAGAEGGAEVGLGAGGAEEEPGAVSFHFPQPREGR